MIKLANAMEKKDGTLRDVETMATTDDVGDDEDGHALDEKFVDMENARDYAENEYAGTKGNCSNF